MITHLGDVLDLSELRDMIARGFITKREHPTDCLDIYNYTDACQYARMWNTSTLTCRGLIVDRHTSEIVARPFQKFFNYGESGAPQVSPEAWVFVTDKLDGSLGIIYEADDGPAVATRGSFVSEQAVHATKWLRENHPDWTPPEGYTVLCEIIYPENRIVVDYGEADKMVALGVVDICTGISYDADPFDLPFEKVGRFKHATIRDALEAAPRRNAEGFVMRLVGESTRIKVKQADYVELHRIVTGWNERTIWERLSSGQSVGDLAEGLPDEFFKWATDTAQEITNAHRSFMRTAKEKFDAIGRLPDRKEFAEKAKQAGVFAPAVFMLYDGRDISDLAWKQAHPKVTRKAIEQ